MRLPPAPPFVTPLPDPTLALRRQLLVTELFKYVTEIHDLKDGYAFKFHRSELLIRRIADYIVFEGRNSPQLSFVIITKPNAGALWLEVRGPAKEKDSLRTTYLLSKPLLVPRG